MALPPTPTKATESFRKPLRGYNAMHLAAVQNRQHLICRLHEEGSEDLAWYLERCGLKMKLRCLDCNLTKEVEVRCERRWCPVCMRKIAAERVARYRFAMDRLQWPLFVTLTIANTVLAEHGIRTLKTCLGRFKKTKWWKGCKVRGGVTAIEVTNRGKGWHPHAHMLMDCEWLSSNTPKIQRGDTKEVKGAKLKAAKADLDHQWAKATGQATASTYVMRSGEAKLQEVLKYSADPETLCHEKGRISELIRAMDKFRMIQPWGCCYGIGKLIKAMAEAEREPCKCGYCEGSKFTQELNVQRPNRPTPSKRPDPSIPA